MTFLIAFRKLVLNINRGAAQNKISNKVEGFNNYSKSL